MNTQLHFAVQLSATPRAARLARLLTVEQLRSWGLLFDDAAQVVSELCANAVTHGKVPGRDFHLALSVTGAGRVRIEVSDTRADKLPGEPRYGLMIVDALSDRWGSACGPAPRKSVWAELMC
ncbi:ATP-binding protein [Streptomyces sp. APSN-46.1]|uniref:ATP-binding protein n=1 Tax=Streptomyces sp. APSN-46.1 TaxID=2929049 RepID=UPI001FB3080B|nr:ATP-binding protein [Streptomyces sp. APSN-46.1]MCJ1678815.1 ATP-binding protein [Streptomyces sp. APSN-46.1]